MRRKDREVTDQAAIAEIINACSCARVGFVDDGQVYIVPMNFGHAKEDGRDVFYFHSGKEGRKIDLLKKCGNVGFEMDTDYAIREAAQACGYTAYYKSIIGQGEMEILTDIEEKKHGLRVLMKHNTGKDDWEFADKMVDAVHILKLTVCEMAAKENVKK